MLMEFLPFAILHEDVMERVIKAVIPAKYIDEITKCHKYHGGPMSYSSLPRHPCQKLHVAVNDSF